MIYEIPLTLIATVQQFDYGYEIQNSTLVYSRVALGGMSHHLPTRTSGLLESLG